MISAAELAELWQHHAGGMEWLARARCGPNDAADCVQVAFIKLAQADPIPDDRLAWLATVVRNEAMTRVRSQWRRIERERKVAEDRGPLLDCSADEFATADWTESQVETIARALAQLSYAEASWKSRFNDNMDQCPYQLDYDVPPSLEHVKPLSDDVVHVVNELRSLAYCEDQSRDLRIREKRGGEILVTLLPEIQESRSLVRALRFRIRTQIFTGHWQVCRTNWSTLDHKSSWN